MITKEQIKEIVDILPDDFREGVEINNHYESIIFSTLDKIKIFTLHDFDYDFQNLKKAIEEYINER